MPNQYWRVELMEEMVANYARHLSSGNYDFAKEIDGRIKEFVMEMSRDLMIANENIIERDKRILQYQSQETENFNEINELKVDKLDLITVMEYYADEETYKMKEKYDGVGDLLEHMRRTSPIAIDLGERARKILKEIKK